MRLIHLEVVERAAADYADMIRTIPEELIIQEHKQWLTPELHNWDHSAFAVLVDEVQSAKLLECAKGNHTIVDCSSGGPDSGDMDHCCNVCGKYWSVPLY